MDKDKTFWVSNISNRNVTLSDLYLSIKAMTSVNLLDKKRYSFTEEQLEKSHTSGSIYAKRDMIKKRVVAPLLEKVNGIMIDKNVVMPSRSISIYEVKIEKYEELQISDDRETNLMKDFEAIAETVDEQTELERAPLISKDKK